MAGSGAWAARHFPKVFSVVVPAVWFMLDVCARVLRTPSVALVVFLGALFVAFCIFMYLYVQMLEIIHEMLENVTNS